MASLIDNEELARALGVEPNDYAAIRAHLQREGIRYFKGKRGRPYTLPQCFPSAPVAEDDDGIELPDE